MNGRSPVLFGIMPDGAKVEAVTLRAAAQIGRAHV